MATHTAFALGMIVALSSCTKQDRVVTVTCPARTDDRVSLVIGALGRDKDLRGALGAREWVPGAIVQMSAPDASGARGGGTVLYTLRTAAADYLPRHPGEWFNGVSDAHFEVHADADVESALSATSRAWKEDIRNGTQIIVAGAERTTLRDPIGLINADRSALEVFKGSATGGHQFAVVTGVEHGTLAGLIYVGRNLAVNMVTDVPLFYLHLSYACPEWTGADSVNPNAPDPIAMFLYLPVKLNPRTGAVETDSHP